MNEIPAKKIDNTYYQAYYQKNIERKRAQRRKRYRQQKEQKQLVTQQKSTQHYGAEAIKILMPFKEYAELSREKKKLWLDFNWTFQDCQAGVDITALMKLEQVVSNLVRDYWTTAKAELRKKTPSWNILSEEQKQKLIRFWSYEKTRIENGYLNEAERLEKQSQEYLKEIELAKFHEELGKLKCSCYQCQAEKKIWTELKSERGAKEVKEKLVCGECQKRVKELDEESGVCKKCTKEING